MTDNELIAEFMGLVRKEANNTYSKAQYYIPVEDNRYKGRFVGFYDTLQYHESWDWLMPVWMKFRDLDLDLNGEYGKWIDALQWYLFSSDEPKRFYERLVYAIKWYNDTRKS